MPATKTLYITDLDGTLLRPDARQSDFTRDALNGLIARGLQFSVATARTAASVGPIFQGVNLNLPLVLLNGVLLYDAAEKRYVQSHTLPPARVGEIIAVLQAHQAPALLYTLRDGAMQTYYSDPDSEPLRAFRQERAALYQKGFLYTPDFARLSPEGVIFFTLLDTRERLDPVQEALSRLPSLTVTTYRDVYSADLWYLEVFSGEASKRNGALYLKETYGFDRVVGFGDNKNDLSLFEACDRAYAVENAREELKAAATGVIGPNTDDGVARWLLANFEPWPPRDFSAVRRATKADAAAIEAILLDAADWMDRSGLHQWERERVKWEVISRSFAAEDFYLVCRDGEAVACMALVDDDPDIWPGVPRGGSLYFHKLAVKRCAAGHGLSTLLLEYAKQKCRERGIHELRLDAHRGRPKVRAIYERAGFRCVEEKLLFGKYETALYLCELS